MQGLTCEKATSLKFCLNLSIDTIQFHPIGQRAPEGFAGSTCATSATASVLGVFEF